jgi:hypothetical protein
MHHLLISATLRCSLCANPGSKRPTQLSSTCITSILHTVTITIPGEVQVENT